MRPIDTIHVAALLEIIKSSEIFGIAKFVLEPDKAVNNDIIPKTIKILMRCARAIVMVPTPFRMYSMLVSHQLQLFRPVANKVCVILILAFDTHRLWQ
ncbi:hypothetical protein HMPREF0541_02558 [Lacticaseibacillus rhamnosus ATCC 21052]|nr:hypothetical protein HMPREF0541_02558 [Lacticaseibacillus rhamnosus ATCC 21052]